MFLHANTSAFNGYEEVLRQSSYLFVDGTFSSAPSKFQQVLIIGSKVNGQFVPVIHGLLMNKRKSTYKIVLDKLKVIIGGDPPAVITGLFISFS